MEWNRLLEFIDRVVAWGISNLYFIMSIDLISILEDWGSTYFRYFPSMEMGRFPACGFGILHPPALWKELFPFQGRSSHRTVRFLQVVLKSRRIFQVLHGKIVYIFHTWSFSMVNYQYFLQILASASLCSSIPSVLEVGGCFLTAYRGRRAFRSLS